MTLHPDFRFALATTLLCGGLILTTSVARGSVLTVTNLSDSGPGSLPSAITDAASGDTIQFAPALSGTILLQSALPTITANLTINGGSEITINGNNSVADFVIAGAAVKLDGVTITGGHAGLSGDGGGIYNAGGMVTVINSPVEGNTATDGGGIYNNSGTLTPVNVIFEGNTAADGGGIYNSGVVYLTDSTFLDNFASFGADIFNNGGTITETPIPAALPLFATGLGGLGLFGWRRKRKNAAALAA